MIDDISEFDMKKDSNKSRSADVSLKRISQLKRLTFDFSSKIMVSPTSAIDKEIKLLLKKMAECLDVDRCTIREVMHDNLMQTKCIYEYSGPGFENEPCLISTRALPWITKKLKESEAVIISQIGNLPDEASVDKKSLREYGIKSYITVPYKTSGRIINAIVLSCWREEKIFLSELIPVLKMNGEIIASAIHRKQMEEKYESALLEIRQVSKLTHLGDRCLEQNEDHKRVYGNIVGQSSIMQNVFSRMEQVAPTDSAVLIFGETGTGKGIIARAIHELSLRRNRPQVTVNCAALSPTLIESELFGREKGAFTGATSRELGRFEFADKSTLILDEIAELSLELQAKLLRVLQDGEFERLGSPKTIKADVRIIAMTSKDLKVEIKNGHFRQELYYRLNVFPITIPPLRERSEDIPLLVDHFVRTFSQKLGKNIKTIPEHTMRFLVSYTWPGNVRHLEHVIERAVIMTKGSTLHLEFNDELLCTDDEQSITNLAEVERRHIVKILEKTKWRIQGSDGAAILLGLNSSTLRARMKKLNISFRRAHSSNK